MKRVVSECSTESKQQVGVHSRKTSCFLLRVQLLQYGEEPRIASSERVARWSQVMVDAVSMAPPMGGGEADQERRES